MCIPKKHIIKRIKVKSCCSRPTEGDWAKGNYDMGFKQSNKNIYPDPERTEHE